MDERDAPVRTIAIINQKGGCGKTTCSINLAAVLAARGHKTLLVDMDPQAHCALGLAVPEAQINQSIGDLLRAGLDGSLALADLTWQISRNLDLAPSNMALAGIEQELAGAPDRDRRLLQVLSTVANRYDFCIIDCPPSIGLLTFNALRAADEVIIPVETGYFALQGSVRQKATIEMLARRAGHRVRFRVLATMYDVRTKLAREILAELKRNFADKLLPIVVHFNSKLKEAASFGQPIVEYDPASRGMQDFESLAQWLMDHPPEHVEAPLPSASLATGIADITGAADWPLHAGMPPRADAAASGLAGAQEPEATALAGANGGMSRAAELVERARALSARTAALADRLARQPDPATPREITRADDPIGGHGHHGNGSGNGSGSGRGAGNGAQNGTGNNAGLAGHTPRSASARPTPQAEDSPPANRRTLREKLARMHGVRQTTQGLLFVQPATDAKQLAIAGDFNNWDADSAPMKLNEELGVYEACLSVPPGRYLYRLVVDGQWVHDPYNSYVEANPFGELNSVLEVG